MACGDCFLHGVGDGFILSTHEVLGRGVVYAFI